MQDRDMIIINNYIENEPLSGSNLEKTLDLVNEFRLLSPHKSIWLYTGYTWNDLWCNEAALRDDYGFDYCERISNDHKICQRIVSKCNVLIDGKYRDSKKDITLKWRGSSNQNVIDIQKSLQKGEVVLWDK